MFCNFSFSSFITFGLLITGILCGNNIVLGFHNDVFISKPSNPDLHSEGATTYWCPTNNGNEWTSIRILGMNVISIKRHKTVLLEEAMMTSDVARSDKHFTEQTKSEHQNEQLHNQSQFSAPSYMQQPSIQNSQTQHPKPRPAKPVRTFSSVDGACFHTSSNCPSGKQIDSSNSMDYLSIEDALNAGLTKCRRCMFMEMTKPAYLKAP